MRNLIRLDQLDTADLILVVQSGIALLASTTGVRETQSFAAALPSGVDQIPINYPVAYPAGIMPKVTVTLENNQGDPFLAHQISGKSNVGFTLLLSNNTRSAAYVASILAKI